jgi:hypothetical protein
MSSGVPWWANSALGALLALLVAWIAISFDRRKTVNQELIRKRLSIYDDMAPKLNDIVCFFSCIGRFKSLPPATIIDHKRDLDRAINVYGPIFSPRLQDRYDAFIGFCFVAFCGGVGRPSLIAADVVWLEEEWGDEWQAGWKSGFVAPDAAADIDEVRRRYGALMRQFAVEVGVAGRRPDGR